MTFSEWGTGFILQINCYYKIKGDFYQRREHLQRGHAPSYTDELPLVTQMDGLTRDRPLCPSLCTQQGQLRGARGKGQVPEGAAEEAGNEEPGQAGQVPQEIHHKVQHELRAEHSAQLS